MVIYIEDINIESLKVITAKISEAKWEHIDFYFDSNGGEITGADFLVHMINKLDNVAIYIDAICSCAIPLVMRLNHKKYLLDGAHGVYHAIVWNSSMSTRTMARWKYDQFKLSDMPDTLAPKEWLTEEENKLYMSWDDVYLNSKRLKEILNIE